MGMGTVGLIGGIGKGIAEGGGILAKFQAMHIDLEEKKKARLEEIAAEYAHREKAEIGKEERVEARVAESARKFRPMFGVDETPKTQADFQKAKPLISNDADMGPPEELTGPPEVADDTEAFGRYQKGQARGAAMAELASRRPEAIDDVQKALESEKFGSMLDEAMKNKDWTAVAKIRSAMKGEGTWRGMGHGMAIDTVTAEMKASDLTASEIGENQGQESRARSGATNDRAGEVGRMAAERVKQLQSQYDRVASETFKEPKNEFDPTKVEKMRSDWEARQEARLRDLGTKLDKAQAEYDRVYGDLSERRGVGGGSRRSGGGKVDLNKYLRK